MKSHTDIASPGPAIRRDAAVSPCGAYRWWLRRGWADGPGVLWIMLNPSSADHERDDPTIRRVIHFSRAWGFGAATVVNLYPFRSAHPDACRRWLTDGAFDAGRLRENDRTIARESRGADLCVAAWGATAWAQPHALRFATRLRSSTERQVHCLGKTRNGAPRHPLARGIHRVPDDQQPLVW